MSAPQSSSMSHDEGRGGSATGSEAVQLLFLSIRESVVGGTEAEETRWSARGGASCLILSLLVLVADCRTVLAH